MSAQQDLPFLRDIRVYRVENSSGNFYFLSTIDRRDCSNVLDSGVQQYRKQSTYVEYDGLVAD